MVSPAAMPIMLASAIPTWKKRSGCAFWNASIFSDPVRSAQSATTCGLDFPSSESPAPKPERVSFFSVYVYFFIVKRERTKLGDGGEITVIRYKLYVIRYMLSVRLCPKSNV